MAINGSGFFVVQQKTGSSDGHSTFSGGTFYTRRGDFDIDKEGYLVNGAGYYLEGLPIDPTSGNVSGSIPSVIKISNSFLPAQATTKIDYQLNLPQLPKDAAYKAGTVGSELLKPGSFLPATGPSAVTGTTTLSGASAANTAMVAGQSMTVTIGGTPTTFDFYDSTVGPYVGANTGIDVKASNTITNALGQIQTALQLPGGTAASYTAGLVSGKVQISLGTDLTSALAVTDGTTGLGLVGASAVPVPGTGPVATIKATDGNTFLDQSTAGGAVTGYASNGSPVNVQFPLGQDSERRVGRYRHLEPLLSIEQRGHGLAGDVDQCRHRLQVRLRRRPQPPVTQTAISNLTVNGVSLGNITLVHGTNGITQFSDANGTAWVTALTQNGYAAGQYTFGRPVNDSGRIVASYSNGQQLDIAQVVTANFMPPTLSSG